MGEIVGTAKILPVVAELFKQNERKKKVEDIMSGRWLPNTSTAEVAYLTYVVNGLPIPEDMANTIYDEFLQKQEGNAFENPDFVAVRKEFSDQPRSAEGEEDLSDTPPNASEEPATIMATEDPSAPVSYEEAKSAALKLLRKYGFPIEEGEGGVAAEGTTKNESPFLMGDPRLSIPTEGFAPHIPTGEGRQVDPFIRMLQTALVMRMLGGTGGAFGALALAPILKDLFDEMMGRKKRDTGQGEKGEEQSKPPTVPQTVPEERRPSLPSKGVDEVVIQLYNRGLSPQQIALALPSIIEEVDLSPQQIEQILNNSGVQGVHIPTTAPKKKEGSEGQKKQNPQGQKQKQNPQNNQNQQNKSPQNKQPQRRPQPPSQPQRRLA